MANNKKKKKGIDWQKVVVIFLLIAMLGSFFATIIAYF